VDLNVSQQIRRARGGTEFLGTALVAGGMDGLASSAVQDRGKESRRGDDAVP
jgi:hypothetical protein